MNSKRLSFLLLAVLAFSFCSPFTNAEGDKKSSQTLDKVQGSPIRAYLNINNVSTVIKNTGISDIDVAEQNSGFFFPKGSGKACFFTSGFLWGVKQDDTVKVGGAAYREGLQGGRILNSNVAWPQLTFESDQEAHVRIYRVRPDVYPGGPAADFNSEVADGEGSADQIRTQYEIDWTEWPAQYGAPFDDKNSNGTYEPATDVPGVLGADQTIWFVGNDLNAGRTVNLYGALPLGIEMQATFWAYNRTGALGNMIFRKYKMINKSNAVFDSVYVSMWSDIDNGNSTDDFSGCDTTLSLGYCYNANAVDATYSPLPPPAVGFDFFQGPLIDGVAGEDRNKNGVDDAADFGITGGQVVGPGKINLPMTSFYYFARGDANLTDPTQGDPQGSIQFYNFFQGRIGKTGEFFSTPDGTPTTFTLSGDPVTRTGWIDGQLLGSGDRRQGQASGPFVMNPGEEQEIVVAQIAAGAVPGVDRLSAIGLLKFYDRTAQDAFDNFFDLPTAPPAPEISIPGTYDLPLNAYYALDRKIVLDWGENQTKLKQTENFDSKGYKFEGYNIYQLPSASASAGEGRKIATYDVSNGILKIEGEFFDLSTGVVATKVQQSGTDNGIKRYLEITRDELNGGTPLINGIRYYFSVTSYAYNGSATLTNLENPLKIFTIIPTGKTPGVSYGGAFADTLASVVHSKGASDGNVFPVVVDPTKLTGLTYKVSFDVVNGVDVWNVDRSDGVRVIAGETNQNSDENSPIADGIQFRVIGAPLDFKNFTVVANGSGALDPPEGGAFDFGDFPSDRPTDAQQVGAGLWGFHTADNGGSNDGGTRALYDAFISRATRDGDNWPEIIPYDFEMRFTGSNDNPGVGGSYAFEAFNDGNVFWVPFELWNIGIGTPDDPSDDYQIVPYVIDDAGVDFSGDNIYALESWGDAAAGSGDLEHSVSGGTNDPFTDWVYWYRPDDKSPGDAGYKAAEAEMLAGTYDGAREHEVMARTVLVNWNGGSAPPFNQDVPEMGTIFRIESTKPNAANTDEFTFIAPAASYDVAEAKMDIKAVNVFPNPYYGVNSEELNKYNRFVTFTHLPTKVTIRLFNLAGVMIKTLEKDNNSTYQRWDLANESGLPVASGLYIAYIEFPDLGETKVLKVAIIQEQQILDRF